MGSQALSPGRWRWGPGLCTSHRAPRIADVVDLEISLEIHEPEFSLRVSVVVHCFKGVQISVHSSPFHPLYSLVYFMDVMYLQRKNRTTLNWL